MKDIKTRMKNLEKKQIKNNVVISGIKMETDNQMDLKIGKLSREKYWHKDTNKRSYINKPTRESLHKQRTDKGRTGNSEKIKEIAEKERKKKKQVKVGYTKVMIDEREYRCSYEDGKLKQQEKMLHPLVQRTKKIGKREKNEEDPSNG
ncbi:hypothetical protein ILUMI_08769 [Ignelater luminosus]|uniref:Uncharacterized protein n=1 Tax=Ignelater luminosus TaxID=2038154 RepID=A0A8K0GAB9_IGNLU|nr:hypothetical protein ILUMI_08769 [Ignelater luminosus]